MPNAHTWTYTFVHATVHLLVDSVVLLLSNQIFLLLHPKEREATAKRQRETEVVNIWLLCVSKSPGLGDLKDFQG